MSKIIVELVKYDTERTKKRKRADLLVEARTEAAVIEKLEKIHKGDKIQTIHSITWSDTDVPEKASGQVYKGTIKYFETKKGFGFIEPDDDMDDLFFHESALGGEEIYDQDPVEFEIGEGPKGPVAIRIKLVD